MATYTCNFVLSGSGRGGQLTGRGFGGGTPPQLSSSDVLNVSVQWTGQNAPTSLTGYFMFSAAQGANQAAPSPFMNGTSYRCFDTQTASASTGPGQTTFNFPGYTYSGSIVGNYELTFIAEINTGTSSATQWSADPEFDTSN